MILFPNAPTISQEFSASGKVWVWNGNGWALKVTEGTVIDSDSLWEEDSGIDSFGEAKLNNIKPTEAKKVHVDHIDKLVSNITISNGLVYNYRTIIEEDSNGPLITSLRTLTSDDWTYLETYLGGSAVAGGKLKSTTSWDEPNTGATNELGINILPSGYRGNSGNFVGLGASAYLWLSNSTDSPDSIQLSYDSSAVVQDTLTNSYGCSIRLVTDDTSSSIDGTIVGTVKDYDGNTYNLIKVGDLAILDRNLATTAYANGTPIPDVKNSGSWSITANEAYCAYNNDTDNAFINTTGLLHPISVSGDYMDLENKPIIPEQFQGFSITETVSSSTLSIGSNDEITIEGAGDTTVTVDPQTNKIIISSTPGTNEGGEVLSFNGRTGVVVPTLGDYNTNLVSEGVNRYFTEARVLATTLSGLDYTVSPSIVQSTDTIIEGMSKLQAQESLKAPLSRTLTIQGNNGISSSNNSAQSLSANRVWTLGLTATGVVAGQYTKVTVDNRGRVTAGSNLTESDIPNLSAAKINTGTFSIARIPVGTTSSTVAAGNHAHSFVSITGKPTTLSGYGITDAAPSSHVGSGGTAHAVATTSVNGFMSSSDKAKLNGIAVGAQVNVPTNLSIGSRTTTTMRLDSSTGTNATLSSATSSQAGLMTAADKSKLNAYPSTPFTSVSIQLSTWAPDSQTYAITISGGGTLWASSNFTVPGADATRSGLLRPTEKAIISSVKSMATKVFWTGTQSAYNAISTKDANTIYFIEE